MKKIIISCVIAFLITIGILVYSYCYFGTIVSDPYELYSLMSSILGSLLSVWLIIPIIIVLIDKYNDNRPKVIITFELIRSSLVCLVIKNIGNSETELISLEIENAFLEQLDEKSSTAFEGMRKTKILIAPKKYWVLNFGVTTFDILDNYKIKEVNLVYKYRKVGRKKLYTEKLNIDFESYSHFMVYISEMDELTNSVDKLTKSIDKNGKSIESKIVETTRLLSNYKEIQIAKDKKL